MTGVIAIILGSLLGLTAAALLALYLHESKSPRLLCLMYHRLASRESFDRKTGTEHVFCIPADAFEDQVRFLVARGYRFVTADEAAQFVFGRLPLTQPSVMITFDDGCASVKTYAEPVLRKHGACATAFVTTDPDCLAFSVADGSEPRLLDEDLRSLDGKVLQFESHGVTHRPLRGLPPDDIRYELAESRRVLEQLLGRPVRYLAIPGNWYDTGVMRIARQCGYHAVWCSNPGSVRPGANPFCLRRINVDGQYSLAEFAAAIRPWGIAQRRLLSFIRRIPGRLLGPRYWLPLRRTLLGRIPGGHVSMRRMMILGGAIGAAAILLLILCLLW